MEDLEQLIITYGYLGLLAGTFVEGETVLLLAGLMAHQGLLELPQVMIVATVGATAGDQFYFYLGRYHRGWLFRKFPSLPGRAEKLYRWVERHPDLLIIASRFVYGFRITTPIVLGTSRVAGWRYSLFNFIGAVIWSVAVSAAGYFLGGVMERLLGDLHKIQHYVFAAILAIGTSIWLYHRTKSRRAAEAQRTAGPPASPSGG